MFIRVSWNIVYMCVCKQSQITGQYCRIHVFTISLAFPSFNVPQKFPFCNIAISIFSFANSQVGSQLEICFLILVSLSFLFRQLSFKSEYSFSDFTWYSIVIFFFIHIWNVNLYCLWNFVLHYVLICLYIFIIRFLYKLDIGACKICCKCDMYDIIPESFFVCTFSLYLTWVNWTVHVTFCCKCDVHGIPSEYLSFSLILLTISCIF